MEALVIFEKFHSKIKSKRKFDFLLVAKFFYKLKFFPIERKFHLFHKIETKPKILYFFNVVVKRKFDLFLSKSMPNETVVNQFR